MNCKKSNYSMAIEAIENGRLSELLYAQLCKARPDLGSSVEELGWDLFSPHDPDQPASKIQRCDEDPRQRFHTDVEALADAVGLFIEDLLVIPPEHVKLVVHLAAACEHFASVSKEGTSPASIAPPAIREINIRGELAIQALADRLSESTEWVSESCNAINNIIIEQENEDDMLTLHFQCQPVEVEQDG